MAKSGSGNTPQYAGAGAPASAPSTPSNTGMNNDLWQEYLNRRAQSQSQVPYANYEDPMDLVLKSAMESVYFMMEEMTRAMNNQGNDEPEGPTYEEIQAENKKKTDLARRDTLVGDYYTNAELATNYIDQQILNERSNASLLGIDYNMDDTVRQTRINDYFASIWGPGEQTELEGLFKTYGTPENFGWTVTRGTGTVNTGPDEGSLSTISKTTPPPVSTPFENTEDDERSLGLTSFLGG